MQKILGKKFNVIGIDNLNAYYDVTLKLSGLDYVKKFATKNNLYWKSSKKNKRRLFKNIEVF